MDRGARISQPSPSVALVLFAVADSIEMLALRRELATLRTLLVARERLLSERRAQIVSFEGRYLRQVGVLYRKLDEWERKIAELHGGPDEEDFADEDDSASTPVEPQLSAADLRELFRGLVKLIHPDFAADAADEQKRTRLMHQANDAYQREDSAALRRMLNGYDPSVAPMSARAVEKEVIRLRTTIANVRQDIEAVNLQVEELGNSDSAKLRERAFEAARQGRDLLAEMAARVNGSIGLAMRRYDLDQSRIARPANGPSVESLVTAETSTT